MELKSCPFCGGRAVMHSAPLYGGETSWSVECRECETRMEWRDSLEEAVDAWNMRHYDRCMLCGTTRPGLLCRRQFVDFITGKMEHV